MFMKHYQLTYLISPEISEKDLKDFPEKINSFLKEEEGILQERENPIRKKLGYPIKIKGEGGIRKRISQAFFASLNFQLNPEKLENLEKKLKGESKILRYLILSKPLPPKKERVEKIPAKTISKIPKKPKKKVELKEIERKLDEILGET